MKHLIFMLAVMAVAVPGALINPFVGLAAYYGLAVLYPQSLWDHALPRVRWSFMVGGATVLGFILHGFARSAAGARWTLEKKLILVICILTFLSVVEALDPELASRRLDDMLKIFLMFFIACSLLDSRYRLHALAVVVVTCLGWVAFDFNQRYVLMGQKHVLTLMFADLDNNGIAALMVLGTPLCMFLFTQGKRWFTKLPPLFAMILMAHVVLMSMSRAGMLGLLAMVPFLLLRIRMKRRWLGPIIAIFVVSVGLRLAGPSVRERFWSIKDYEQDVSSQTRLKVWSACFDVVRQYPVLGVGPDCFRTIAGDYDYSIKNRSVHNRFIQMAVDNGLPAMVALIALLAVSFYRLQLIRVRNKDDLFAVNLATALQAMLAGYATVGMFASIGTVELPYIGLAMGVGLQNVIFSETPAPALEPTPVHRRRARLALDGMRAATT